MAWIMVPPPDASPLQPYYNITTPLSFSFLLLPYDGYASRPSTHNEGQNGPAFPPGHSCIRQGNVCAFHPDCGSETHHVCIPFRRTGFLQMLLNMERSMSCLIVSLSLGHAIPRNTRHTSSLNIPRIHKRTAMDYSPATNRTPCSPIEEP